MMYLRNYINYCIYICDHPKFLYKSHLSTSSNTAYPTLYLTNKNALQADYGAFIPRLDHPLNT